MKRYRVWKRNYVQQKRTLVLYKRQNQHGHWKFTKNQWISKIGQEETICKYQVLQNTPESHRKSVNTRSMTCQKKNWRWTQGVTIERAHRVGEKWNDKESAIVVQFSFYKDKITISETVRSLRELEFPYSKVIAKRQCKFVQKNGRRHLANRKQDKISYLQYRSVVCKEGRTPA